MVKYSYTKMKILSLTLASIKYSGDSVGDDIRAEIDVFGKFLRVDKIIKAGATKEINQEIGKFETDQKLFKSGIRIAIIEKDLLFNDVGNIDSDIEIDTKITKSQQFIYKVEIKETRSVLGKFWGKKIANFEVTLEAQVVDAVLYIPNEDDGKGWLKVKLADNKSIESLPAYLKVKPEHINNGREYFTILEGAHYGKSASAVLKKDGSSNLISGIQHEPMALASYSISKKTFTLNSKIYETVDYKNAPWKKGLYDIEIPDYPHSGGARYEKKAPRAKTWFRIGHNGERYLHTGGQSLGCITIIEITRWAEIYNALIKARKSDSVSVGILEVID